MLVRSCGIINYTRDPTLDNRERAFEPVEILEHVDETISFGLDSEGAPIHPLIAIEIRNNALGVLALKLWDEASAATHEWQVAAGVQFQARARGILTEAMTDLTLAGLDAGRIVPLDSWLDARRKGRVRVVEAAITAPNGRVTLRCERGLALVDGETLTLRVLNRDVHVFGVPLPRSPGYDLSVVWVG